MSALTSPAPSAPVSPKPSAPVPAPPKRTWLWVGLILSLIGGAAGIWYVRGLTDRANQIPVATLRTAVVKRGPLEIRLRVNGATAARNFVNVTAPRLTTPESGREMTLLRLADSGSFVKAGELVAEFDPQSAQDHLDDTVAGLKDKDNSVLKRKAELDLDMETMKQSLLEAKAALDKAQLDLRTSEIRSDIDREVLKLAVAEADEAYREMLSEMPLKEASQKADLRITEISRDQERLHVSRHEVDISRLKVRAGAGGMVVLLSQPRPGGDQLTFAVGDRLTPGTLFGRVIDPSSMQVEGYVNQAESGQFRIGQEATVRVDAYPGLSLKGRVNAIGALAVNTGRANYYIRSVPIRIQILEQDPRVIPDLSAAADVVVEREENALLAPAGAIQQENGQTFVMVKNGDTLSRKPVTLGLTQGAQVEIESGVAEGDVVVVN